ncbi:hypothetical protein BDV19DRAFT_392494 [Aspergillus venezuelensis]
MRGNDPRTVRPNGKPVEGFTPKHILVVENNKVNRLLATKIFQRFNCTITAISNGPEALAYLADPRNPRPHLIFIKVYSLGSTPDGHEVAEIIRTRPPFIHDPVLQLTPVIGTIPPITRFDRQRYGFINDFLEKPMRLNQARWALRTWARKDPWRAKL